MNCPRMLDGISIKYLRKIAQGKTESQIRSSVSIRYSREHDIGRIATDRIVYGEGDPERAIALLNKAGIPLEAPEAAPTRSANALHGYLSEKSGSRHPYEGSVLIRALTDRVTWAGDDVAPWPGFAHLVDAQIANEVKVDIVLLVENLETFRRLDRYRWIPRDQGSILAVYRGDRQHSAEVSTEVLTWRERVWAFVDYDPAGLVIASSLARKCPVERVISPGFHWLGDALNQHGKLDLFHEQHAFHAAAGKSDHPDIRSIWKLVYQNRKGLPQEATETAAA